MTIKEGPTSIDDLQARTWVPVEFYVARTILSGYIRIASDLRLLDILNKVGIRDQDSSSDYVEFVSNDGSENVENKNGQYVRKNSIDMASIGEPNLARGVGAVSKTRIFLVKEKIQIPVSIQIPGYTIDGTMHCCAGKSVRDTLDEKTDFLPLTEVTIALDGHFYGTRPFVAVKKERIISLKEG